MGTNGSEIGLFILMLLEMKIINHNHHNHTVINGVLH